MYQCPCVGAGGWSLLLVLLLPLRRRPWIPTPKPHLGALCRRSWQAPAPPAGSQVKGRQLDEQYTKAVQVGR
jgi:hypothetical protein